MNKCNTGPYHNSSQKSHQNYPSKASKSGVKQSNRYHPPCFLQLILKLSCSLFIINHYMFNFARIPVYRVCNCISYLNVRCNPCKKISNVKQCSKHRDSVIYGLRRNLFVIFCTTSIDGFLKKIILMLFVVFNNFCVKIYGLSNES